MEKRKFYKLLQTRIANVSISASAVRGAGKGVKLSATNFLKDIALQDFKKALEDKTFNKYLNQQTDFLMEKLPKKSKFWGISRKCLNLFFRDIFYNAHFYIYLALDPKFANQLEIPLDSYTGKAIRKKSLEFGEEPPPSWKTVIGLKPKDSQIFQKAGKKIAKDINKNGKEDIEIYCVDLDLIFWRSGKSK